jgi:hypothetical protein
VVGVNSVWFVRAASKLPRTVAESPRTKGSWLRSCRLPIPRSVRPVLPLEREVGQRVAVLEDVAGREERPVAVEDGARGREAERVAQEAAAAERVLGAHGAQRGLHVDHVLEQPVAVVELARQAVGVVAAQHALVLEVPEREPVGEALARAAHRQVVLLAAARLRERVEPVGAGVALVEQPDVGGPVLRDRRAELLRAQQVRRPRHLAVAVVDAVGDLRAALAAVLGGDEHHPVAAAAPVDGRRLGVLEDGDVGDVLRVDEVERVAAAREPAADGQRDAVDDEQRVVDAVDRRLAAHAHRDAAAGLVAAHHLHAGHLGLDQVLGAHHAPLVEQGAVHRRHRAGHVAPVLRAAARVGHRDHLGELGRHGRERHVGRGRAVGRHVHGHRLRPEADALHAQRARARRDAADGEAAVGAGLGAERGAVDAHAHADDAEARGGVDDAAGDRAGLGLGDDGDGGEREAAGQRAGQLPCRCHKRGALRGAQEGER